MTRKVVCWIVAPLLGLFLAGFAIVGIGSTIFRRNFNKVEAYVPRIEARIREHPEFSDVDIFAYTAHLGSFLVDGYVGSQSELEELKKCVEAMNPPRRVEWNVEIRERDSPVHEGAEP